MSTKQPPRPATWLLKRVTSARWLDQMLDDLDQLHAQRCAREGATRAALRYWQDVLSICLRPSFWGRPAGAPGAYLATQAAMIRYEVVVGFRHMRRRSGFVALNALGLAAGLVCALFIGLYVRHELSYDTYHPQTDRTYRLVLSFLQSERHWAPIGPPVGLAVADAFPEVKEVVRFFPMESAAVVGAPDQQVLVERAGFADENYFGVFHRPLLAGDPATALSGVGQVVISRDVALRAFGHTDVVGQALPQEGQRDALTVTGVMEDSPSNTHQPVDMLISMVTFYAGNESWLENARTWAGFHTYLVLQEGADPEVLTGKLPDFVDTFFAGVGDGPASQFGALSLQPLADIHLRSAREKEYVPNSDVRYVYTFSVVGLLVLIIAAFNFVNLATAKADTRRLEIGVRKTFGAPRSQLLRQFLTESVLYAGLALVATLVLAALTFPFFAGLSGIPLGATSLWTSSVLGPLLLLTVATGLLAGFYPAAVVSGFRPISALRAGRSPQGGALRKTLVVFQFAVCVALIASAAIVWSQLTFLRSASMGFDKEHVLRVNLTDGASDAVTANPETFQSLLGEIPGVLVVSQASDVPGSRYSVEGMQLQGSDERHMMRVAWRSDHAYPEALGLEFVAGRSFSRFAPADTSAWVINEAAARTLGLDPAEAPGSVISWGGNYTGSVVGVVRDFNFASLRDAVEPLVIPLRPGHGELMLVRFEGHAAEDILPRVREALSGVFPGEFLTYSFVGSEIEALYRKEDTLRAVIAVFAVLAILVACLGLFGLAAHSASRRTREIGIRKVLGASERSILALFSNEYAWQIAAAILLSVPLVIISMQRWLNTFAYRIDLSPTYFLLAGGAALLLAMITIGGQALRAAKADPVSSLRHD